MYRDPLAGPIGPGKAILNKYFFSFVFTKGSYSLRRFNYIREFIPNCLRSYRESMFAKNQRRFRNNIVFGNG